MPAMLNSLLENSREEAATLSVRQIVAICGDGVLRDYGKCSAEFCDFLRYAKVEMIARYCQECLSESFTDSGFVLQDLVNELGRRLDFAVENGLYRGKSNAIGFDGIWAHESGRALLVEVKTTDAYRINLDDIISYRTRLADLNRIPAQAPCLIVVGREDTGDLEAQVRGSRHAWDIRIISIDALLRLVALKQNADESTAYKIREILTPLEYTRLDRIIDLAFTAAKETSDAVSEELEAAAEISTSDTDVPKAEIESSRFQQHTPEVEQQRLRESIMQDLSQRSGTRLIQRSRATYWTPDHATRAVISISKLYPDGWYWYGYHISWHEFFSGAKDSTLALGCVGQPFYFAIPADFINALTEHLNVSPAGDGIGHWHIHLQSDEGGSVKLKLHKTGDFISVDQFRRDLQT